jgi:hypothetical protein
MRDHRPELVTHDAIRTANYSLFKASFLHILLSVLEMQNWGLQSHGDPQLDKSQLREENGWSHLSPLNRVIFPEL